MGVVYRAVDSVTGQPCALKRIKPEAASDRQGIESFEREYRVLAGIDHPRIIHVYEYGVDRDGPYYTMELVEGNDLRTLAPLDYREACRYLRDVAASLALLHARRLLHRDLSPRNVRVTPDGHCKLLDFGALTGFGPSSMVVGTPPAIAPEVVRGAALDQRTDLYALGALAYWLLTRRHAYPARRIDELPELWRDAAEPPSSLTDGIPPRLDELVLALLNRDPLARPASAAEVIGKLNVIAQLDAEDGGAVTELATSFLATPHFVGRGAELEALETRVAAAVRGHGGAVLLEGAAGVGRTRLLDEVGVIGQLAGAHVLRVDASMHRQPHGTARALVRHLLDSVPRAAATTARLSPAAIAQVGELEARMRLRHSMPMPAVHAEPSLTGGVSLESWLADVSDATPLLLQVDNVEYADDASLGFLAALARGSRSRRLLLVVTQKPLASGRTSVGLSALRPHCDRIALEALSTAETLELARSLFGDANNVARFGEFLYARTAGNPMHCLEIARQLIAERVIRYLDGNWALPAERPDAALPAALEGALSARLTGLSAGARSLAECLSLHRGELSLALCRKLMGPGTDRELFALQDELARNDIMHVTDNGYRFSSTALQETLLAEMDESAREQSHKRLGEALLQTAGPRHHALQIQAGWHLLQGGEPTRGAELIDAVACDSVAVRLVFTDLHGAGVAIEAALRVYARERRSLCERLPLLSALAQAGYYEDRRWGERYGDEALDALEEVSGLRTARRLRRYVGRFMGLVLGLGYGALKFTLTPRRERRYNFGEVLMQLFGVVTCLTGVAALCLDAARARTVADVLEPFAVLPERMTPVGIYQFCQSLRQIALENQAQATEKFDMLLERFQDPRYYPTLPAEARKIYLAGVHFARAVFATYRNDGRAALQSADALDTFDLKFYAMIASQMRFLYYMNRGDFRTAAQHRQQVDIHAAHVGSAWQVETWEPAALIPVYTWLLDADGMARVADRLELLARDIPSLRAYARLARWAQGLVLADEAQAANATALAMIERAEPRSYIGWAMHLALTAMGSRILGNHDVARRLCDTVTKHLTDADREYVTLFLVVDIERAWCEATAGRPDAAIAQLDALLQRFEGSDHPLVQGLLHEARALIAHGAGRELEMRRSAAEVERWLRPTGNPALIAKCERLARLATRERAPSGRRENAEVQRWLDLLAGAVDPKERNARGAELLRQATHAQVAAVYHLQGGELGLAAQTAGGGFSQRATPELHEALQRLERELLVAPEPPSVTKPEDTLVQVELGADAQGMPVRGYLLVARSGTGVEQAVGAVALSLDRAGKAPPRALLSALAQTLGWDDATVAEPTRSLPRRSRAAPA
jgi:hypothetical protein